MKIKHFVLPLVALLLTGCQSIPRMEDATGGDDSGTISQSSRQSESQAGPAMAQEPQTGATETQPGQSGSEPLPSSPKCSRVVLRRYCLGETVQSLTARHGALQQARSENRTLLLFRDGKRLTRVTAFDDRILVVSRFYSRPDWNLLAGLHHQLVQLYGKAADRSRFPKEDRDRTLQEQAIRDGKGEVRLLWKQPGFRVQLLWSGKERIVLSFLAEELGDRLKKPATRQDPGPPG